MHTFTPASSTRKAACAIARLPASEQTAVEQFHRTMAPIVVDGITAVWFLRESDGNVTKAACACTCMCVWRSEPRRIDDMAGRPFGISPVAEATLNAVFSPITLDGVDRVGRPVMYTPCGRIDLPKLAKQGVTIELLLRRYVVEAEKVRLALGRAEDPLAGHLQVRCPPYSRESAGVRIRTHSENPAASHLRCGCAATDPRRGGAAARRVPREPPILQRARQVRGEVLPVTARLHVCRAASRGGWLARVQP